MTTNANVAVNTPFGAPSGFTKKGTGTLTLNYYDPPRIIQGGSSQDFNPKGIVNVNEGTLAIDGNASLNGTIAINVAPGAALLYNSSTPLTVAPMLNGAGASNKAVLGGTGPINVPVPLDDRGDTLSPGNSPGIMPYGVSQTWSSFTYDWQTNNWDGDLTGSGLAGTDFDQIAITGSLDLSATAADSYLLNILSLDGSNVPGDVPNFDDSDQSWTILTTTGGITGFDVAEWQVDASGFTNPDEGTWSIALANGDSDLVLNYTVAGAAVPEPATLALLGLGLGGIAGYCRRRKR